MKNVILRSLLLPAFLLGCQTRDSTEEHQQSLSKLKTDFENQILHRGVEEGPFGFSYQYRTVFLSNEVISLFGELSVADRLPRIWKQYECKTLFKDHNNWEEVTLSNLFSSPHKKELLRKACENQLKDNPLSYFSGNTPLYLSLKLDHNPLFVIDHQYLIVIFGPYSVGGCCDGPLTAKIPLSTLQNEWNLKHPLLECVSRAIESRDYITTWETDNEFCNSLYNY